MKGREIMDWTNGLQKAVDYIEEHLTDNMSYDEISKQSFSSTFHLQRGFADFPQTLSVNAIFENKFLKNIEFIYFIGKRRKNSGHFKFISV